MRPTIVSNEAALFQAPIDSTERGTVISSEYVCNIEASTTTGIPQLECCFGTQKTFPFKLYRLLEDADIDGFSDIVSWQAGGLSFKVHKPKAFSEEILPKRFNQTKYKSFLRQ
jgi:hypothetical protein